MLRTIRTQVDVRECSVLYFKQGPRIWLCQSAGAAAPSGGRELHAVSDRGGAIIMGFALLHP